MLWGLDFASVLPQPGRATYHARQSCKVCIGAVGRSTYYACITVFAVARASAVLHLVHLAVHCHVCKPCRGHNRASALPQHKVCLNVAVFQPRHISCSACLWHPPGMCEADCARVACFMRACRCGVCAQHLCLPADGHGAAGGTQGGEGHAHMEHAHILSYHSSFPLKLNWRASSIL